MSASSFQDFREGYSHRANRFSSFAHNDTLASYIVRNDTTRNRRGEQLGWCVFAGYDGRNYAVFLMRDTNDREPMVRVGCRFFTLAQARKHWTHKNRNLGPKSRRSAAQILMLIGIALDRALRLGYFIRRGKRGRVLDNVAPKFDTRPHATKRKAGR